jgi:hypothetical protein
MEPLPNRLFWLHIYKSGGTSTRALLGEHYRQSDRFTWPECFLSLPRPLWNDVLNNWRVPLGRWHFRRSLYAKTHLYPEWDSLLRIAFVREPLARCVSMFHYLFLDTSNLSGRIRSLAKSVYFERRAFLTSSRAFDLFLDVLEERLERPMAAIDRPRTLHFTCHTGRMWEDVTDLEGRILMNRIYRLEDLNAGLVRSLEELGLAVPAKLTAASTRLRARRTASGYRPRPGQRARVERLFGPDYGLYEGALRP